MCRPASGFEVHTLDARSLDAVCTSAWSVAGRSGLRMLCRMCLCSWVPARLFGSQEQTRVASECRQKSRAAVAAAAAMQRRHPARRRRSGRAKRRLALLRPPLVQMRWPMGPSKQHRELRQPSQAPRLQRPACSVSPLLTTLRKTTPPAVQPRGQRTMCQRRNALLLCPPPPAPRVRCMLQAPGQQLMQWRRCTLQMGICGQLRLLTAAPQQYKPRAGCVDPSQRCAPTACQVCHLLVLEVHL